MIVEGVHLLADDVGLLADASGEQSGFLEDWGSNFAVVVCPEDAARDRFDMVPNAGRGRKDIARAFNSSNQEGSSR
jgi:hypothetical protein